MHHGKQLVINTCMFYQLEINARRTGIFYVIFHHTKVEKIQDKTKIHCRKKSYMAACFLV